MKLGVFDSGVGGESVANAITRAKPKLEIIYVQDKENLPYGTKTREQLLELVSPIIQRLVDQGCQIVVIACNTVTTNIIAELRANFTVPLIGIEPMIGPAVEKTASRTITVCATPATLASPRYRELKSQYANDVNVIEPDCSNWVSMIEDNNVDQEHIHTIVEESLEQGSDVFVMGCTHYHWIEDIIDEMTADKAVVLQPETAVIAQLERVIEELEQPS